MRRYITIFMSAFLTLSANAQTPLEFGFNKLSDAFCNQYKLPEVTHSTEVEYWDETDPEDALNQLIAVNAQKRAEYPEKAKPELASHPESRELSGVVWLDWKSYNHTSAPSANTHNSSEAYIEASAEKQDDYKWVIPEGLAAKDIMSDEDGQMSIVLLNGTLARYKEKVNLVKAHGFTEDANENEVPGQMNIYQAENKDGYEVSVMLYQKKLSIIFDKRP